MRKVYYATHPGHDDYRWFTRGPQEPYIMIHKNAVSKSPLQSHSFYGDMEFVEVTVKDTIKWINYVLDTGKYISQQDFEVDDVILDKKPSWKDRQVIGRGTRKSSTEVYEITDEVVNADDIEYNYTRGDVVIGKNMKGTLWLIELGHFDSGKWKIHRGFKLEKEELGKKPGYFETAFLYLNDIQRLATQFEKQYFEECYKKQEVLPMNGNMSHREFLLAREPELGEDSETEQVRNIIEFGSKRKKEKVKSNKVKLTVSKIKTVEI